MRKLDVFETHLSFLKLVYEEGNLVLERFNFEDKNAKKPQTKIPQITILDYETKRKYMYFHLINEWFVKNEKNISITNIDEYEAKLITKFYKIIKENYKDTSN